MSHLKFDWLFGKSIPQARPPLAGISQPGGSHVARIGGLCHAQDERYTENKTQKITISGEDCEVTAHKTGTANWKAYGYVKGMPVQAVGDTAQAAFSHWRDLAKTMLND
jgi:hypothetical protein